MRRVCRRHWWSPEVDGWAPLDGRTSLMPVFRSRDRFVDAVEAHVRGDEMDSTRGGWFG